MLWCQCLFVSTIFHRAILDISKTESWRGTKAIKRTCFECFRQLSIFTKDRADPVASLYDFCDELILRSTHDVLSGFNKRCLPCRCRTIRRRDRSTWVGRPLGCRLKFLSLQNGVEPQSPCDRFRNSARFGSHLDFSEQIAFAFKPAHGCRSNLHDLE